MTKGEGEHGVDVDERPAVGGVEELGAEERREHGEDVQVVPLHEVRERAAQRGRDGGAAGGVRRGHHGGHAHSVGGGEVRAVPGRG